MTTVILTFHVHLPLICTPQIAEKSATFFQGIYDANDYALDDEDEEGGDNE